MLAYVNRNIEIHEQDLLPDSRYEIITLHSRSFEIERNLRRPWVLLAAERSGIEMQEEDDIPLKKEMVNAGGKRSEV